MKTIRCCGETSSSSNKLNVRNQFFSLLRLTFLQTLSNQMLNSFEWRIFRSLCKVDLWGCKKLFSKNNFFLIRKLKYGFISMFIEMDILISALKKVTVLVFYLSHNFHSTPFIHFISQLILITEVVSVTFLVLKGIFVKLTSDCLTTYIRSNCCFVINKSLHNWNNMGKLCANIDY